VVLAPYGGPVPNNINDNLSRVIDVKGDTTVEFTIPWINFLDWRPSVQEGTYAGYMDFGPWQMQLSVFNSIVSSDAATDANIDLVMWTAAAPDCQFSNAAYTGTFERLHARFRPQADIQEHFKRTFPPFVENCTMYTDQHYVTSELADNVIDNCKRYQSSSVVGTTTGAITLFGEYEPLDRTVGYVVTRSFMFRRGGVLYRTNYHDPTPGAGLRQQAFFNVQNSTAGQPLNGQPALISDQPNQTIQFAVPWMENYPYYPQSLGAQNTCTFTYQGTVDTVPSVLCAARDDYELGYLIYPLLSEGSRFGKPKKKALPRPPPPPKHATGSKTSLGFFSGL